MSKNAVIFDLDGTLANVEHRLHHVRNGSRDWSAFFDAMVDDTPNEYVIELNSMIAQAARFRFDDNANNHLAVFVCSGRPETHRRQTHEWLGRHGVFYYALLMRAEKDYRPDHVVKKEMLDNIRSQGYDVLFSIDDRPTVVEMWRANGVPCFAVDDSAWRDTPTSDYSGKYLLTLMVGPSGAGKTTWLGELTPVSGLAALPYPPTMSPSIYKTHVLSSDQIRQDLCGDWRDQSRNDEVFAALHDVARTRLKHGLPTVIDATHLRRRDRLSSVGLAPAGSIVRYVVMNRPLEDKLKSSRTPEHVIRKHDQMFKSQLDDILMGDGLPNVEVIDLRQDGV